MRKIACLMLAMMLVGCAAAPATVSSVDLSRYAGTWYEIAKLPQDFEKGCTGVTASYAVLPDGKVEVVNTCREGSVEGKSRVIRGTARSVNAPANSRLKVMFYWPFEGDYWVFRLNADYTTAVVGSPDRRSLWVLHRTPRMEEKEYGELIGSLRADGFPVEKLERTIQR